jgi:hypothetical protein
MEWPVVAPRSQPINSCWPQNGHRRASHAPVLLRLELQPASSVPPTYPEITRLREDTGYLPEWDRVLRRRLHRVLPRRQFAVETPATYRRAEALDATACSSLEVKACHGLDRDLTGLTPLC